MILSKWWLPVSLLLLLIITAGSLLPVPAGPPGSDKLMHLVSYGVLMFPAAYAANKYPWVFAIFFFLWSGGIEIIQPYFNRYGEWRDLLANALGLIVGFLLGQLAKHKLTINL